MTLCTRMPQWANEAAQQHSTTTTERKGCGKAGSCLYMLAASW